jgi:aminoglycoside phosphotransferase (APT) family kinase protein
LPRREAAARLVENEQRWLPEIAGRVTVAVPAPVREGTPGAGFPWKWTIARWVDGDRASDFAPAELESIVTPLATFVRDLHVPAPADAPANPVRGVALAARANAIDERLASGLVPNAERIADVWRDSLAAAAWSGADVWLHGDLHPANILISGGGLASVIDFGDVCAGDPATDLATAWLTFDPAGRRAFRDSLEYDAATWRRARGWAILLGTALVSFSADNPALMAIGEHALEQVLLD